MALCLLEVYYKTSSISVLSFHYLIQFGNRCFMFYTASIHLLWFLNWKKNAKWFLGQERDFFHLSVQAG